MKRIIRIGMDVHSTNYTLCAMEPIIGEDDRIFATIFLYNQLAAAKVKCVILAPTTMLTPQGIRVKTDARDEKMIAQYFYMVVIMLFTFQLRMTIL